MPYFSDNERVYISVERKIPEEEANEIILFMKAKLDENEFLYSISEWNGYVNVLTTIGKPKKGSIGLAGPAYRLKKDNGTYVLMEKSTWIS